MYLVQLPRQGKYLVEIQRLAEFVLFPIKYTSSPSVYLAEADLIKGHAISVEKYEKQISLY